MKALQLTALTLLCIVLLSCSTSSKNADYPDASVGESDTSTTGGEDALCPVGALFDEEEDTCYIDCTELSDEQCDALDLEVFGEFDEFIDSEFSGAGVNIHSDNSEEQIIAIYTVNNELQLSNVQNDQPENEALFQQIWASANALLPQPMLKQALSEFHITTDGEGGSLAYVNTDDNLPGKWILAFDTADYTTNRDPEFIHTTIHEFGHLVFLNKEQVNMEELGDCPTYAIAEGCSNETSFINGFYQKFWLDTIDEHQATVGPEESEEGITEFYEKYPDRFVSEYAATNPVEDAAEVFTRFVLGNKPPELGTIAEQKIRAMYDFKELVKLRSVIRGKLSAMR